MRLLGMNAVPLLRATALFLMIAASALCPSQAFASVAPTKWLFAFDVGRNVNKTKIEVNAPQEERNECTVVSKDACQVPVEEGTGPREFFFNESIAVSKLTGDVYVGEKSHRVQVLGPEGEFLFTFGWNVNKTKVALGVGVTQQEKNICAAGSGDQCGEGESGTGLAGQIFDGESLTVDPETGDLYVLDPEYHRVEQYTSMGEFVSMFGGQVNKKGGGICTKAEESECKAGIEGSSHGSFENLQLGGYGNLLTFGGPENLLYVADEGRVQKFDASGSWVDQIAISGTPEAVAVDNAGDLFMFGSGAAGVHEYNAEDELQPCTIDPSSEHVRGLAFDAAERLGLTEQTESKNLVAVYETQGVNCGKIVSEIGVTGQPTGISFGLHEDGKGEAEDQLYVANPNNRDVEGYLASVFPEVETCSAKAIAATTAELCGNVNPAGLLTRGFFEYGTEEGKLDFRSRTVLVGEGTAFEPLNIEILGLTPNQQYFDQAGVEAEVGGVARQASASTIDAFRTKGPPPEVPGTPSASLVTDKSGVLGAQVNPEHSMTRYSFEYARCESESEALAACHEARTTALLTSEAYGVVNVAQEISGLAPRATYVYRLVAENQFEFEGKPEGGRTVGAEAHFTTGSLPVPSASTGAATAVTATGAIVSGAINPDGPAETYAFELGVYAGAATQYGIVFSGPVDAGLEPVEKQLALSGLQPATTYAYRIWIQDSSDPSGMVIGETRVFTTSGLPSVLESPVSLPMLLVPATKFPTATGAKPRLKSTVKCKRGYQRNKRNKCVKKLKRAKGKAHSGRRVRPKGKSEK